MKRLSLIQFHRRCETSSICHRQTIFTCNIMECEINRNPFYSKFTNRIENQRMEIAYSPTQSEKLLPTLNVFVMKMFDLRYYIDSGVQKMQILARKVDRIHYTNAIFVVSSGMLLSSRSPFHLHSHFSSMFSHVDTRFRLKRRYLQWYLCNEKLISLMTVEIDWLLEGEICWLFRCLWNIMKFWMSFTLFSAPVY
jgi:hypothetical protein